MKTSKFLRVALLLAMAGFTMSSCGDDKDPEIVIDPVSETIEYYIAGKVVADGAALSGVEVVAGDAKATTDEKGEYTLTVGDKKTYAVSFTKDGYAAINDVQAVVASNAANRSLVALNATMSKMGVTAAADGEKGIVVTEKGEGVAADAIATIEIPANGFDGTSNITLTPYVENSDASDSKPGTTVDETFSLMNVTVTSSNQVTLDKDMTLSIKNGASEQAYLDDVEIYEKENTRAAAGWKKCGEAQFDHATNSYKAVIKAGSSLANEYSVRVKSSVTTSTVKNNEVLSEETKSNAGNLSAVSYDIPYQAKLGWSLSTTGLSADMAALVKFAIASEEGGSEGVYTVGKTFTANISGDYHMYFSCKAQYVEKTYTFSVNGGQQLTVSVKHYLGVDFVYLCNPSSMHSGGSIG